MTTLVRSSKQPPNFCKLAIGIQAFQFFHSFSQLRHHISCDVIACVLSARGQLMAVASRFYEILLSGSIRHSSSFTECWKYHLDHLVSS